ncbi:MAG: MATE family efflux transporter, partial [Luteibaculum sp.]
MRLELNFKSVMRVASPIMLGGFVQFVLTFVDTAFLGHIGELELNAAGNAGLIYITMFLVAQGLGDALQILTSRRLGENRSQDLKNLFWNAVLLLLIISLLCFLLVGFCSPFFLPFITKDKVLVESMTGFLSYRAFGYFFSVTQLGIVAFYSGIARTKILAYSTTILATVNLLFDYLLIYGIGFFPEMGLNGAALASVIAEISSLLFSILYLRRDQQAMNWIRFTGFVLLKEELKKLLKLAFPIMGQRFLAMSSWTVFFFLIEKLGRHPLAVSQLIRSLYFLAFIPIMGFGTTAKTYVSNFMANRSRKEILSAIRYLAILGLLVLVLIIHGYLLYPGAIISILTNDEQLIRDSIPLLKLVFFQAQIFILASVVFNSVAGVGDSKSALLIEQICILVYLAATYYVTVINPQSVFVVWCMEFVYFSTLLLASVAYFKFS